MGDSAMVSPSIALLQERFRELQRVKEDRERKELLRLYSGSKQIPSLTNYQQPKLDSHQQEMVFLPSEPPFADSRMKLQSNCADFQVMTSTSLTNSRPSVENPSKQICFDSSDIDTTLRL